MGKREDILEATLQLINEDGLQSVTFAKIFKRANVGSSTVYHYFQDKEQLVNELFDLLRIHRTEQVMNNYDANQPIYERVKTILRNMAQYALKYPEKLTFLENHSYSPYIAEEIRNAQDPSVVEVFSIIREGQQQGIIKDMERIILIQLLYGMITSVIKGHLAGEYKLDQAQIQQVIELCWKTIKV
ncbi:TetR/AcrR family transcriptional regulator [Paenibacillus sp. 1P07SE]|uniref:TetR/AcrR family transcriptional regulator n=1 Tax=Paenibacillus sp. 1P07SE TaxID=3132209 RepID=UPI0039A659C6